MGDQKKKRHKKHVKYSEEKNRMDYEGGNYGDPDSSRKPDEIEGVPVKRKGHDTDDSSSRRGDDNPRKDRDKGR